MCCLDGDIEWGNFFLIFLMCWILIILSGFENKCPFTSFQKHIYWLFCCVLSSNRICGWSWSMNKKNGESERSHYSFPRLILLVSSRLSLHHFWDLSMAKNGKYSKLPNSTRAFLKSFDISMQCFTYSLVLFGRLRSRKIEFELNDTPGY